MIKYYFFGLLFFCSCMHSSLPNHHWRDWQPYVVNYTPFAGAVFSDAEQNLFFKFSQPLDETSITSKSIFIIKKSDFELNQSDWKTLALNALNGDVFSLDLSYDLSDDGLSLTIKILTRVTQHDSYVLLITPYVLSQKKAPFDQSVLSGNDVPYFMVEYHLESKDAEINSDVVLENAGADAESDSVVNETQDSPIVDGVIVEGPFESEDDVAETQVADTKTIFDSVIITEIVTDPQQDFNDTSGGDGVKFNVFVGEGTVGSTDEYIELYNPTQETINLTDYVLNMSDETKESQTLSQETWPEFLFSEGSTFDSFLPGDFVVLGNPVGSINNTLTIELLDSEATVLQTVFVEDANADDLSNEAYSFDLLTNEWAQTTASPGF